MAVNTSKASLGNLYRRINGVLGTPISAAQMALGNEAPNYESYEFIEAVNAIVRELAGETEMLHRIYIIRSDVGMMRYIKYTREEGEGDILCINLDGQTATLPGGAALDVECLGIQFEKICSGEGVDFDPAGVSATPTAPDTFPKIYYPAESNVAAADMFSGTGAVGNPLIYNPLVRLKGAGGFTNQPALSSLLDIQFVGWSTGDPTDTDNYPTTSDEESFFPEPYLTAALALLTVTFASGAVVGTALIPRSADAYLNDTWATNWGVTGLFVSAALTAALNGTFMVDGITYTVTVTDPSAGAGDFDIVITDGVSTWTYEILSTRTPWQNVVIGNGTVPAGVHRWGNLFTAGQDHAWYLKLDDQRIKLPDDVEKIEWVWKVPKSSWTDVIDEDADVDDERTAVGDSDWFLYNPMDKKNHYFPVTESLWSSIKWMQTFSWISKNYAGFYIQKGQQIRIEPKHTDPIAICAQCRNNLADETTTIDEFDTTYLEIPALAVDCIQYKMLADYFKSLRSGDTGRSDRWEADYQKAKSDLKKLYVAKQGQSADGPVIRHRLQSNRHSNSFGYNILRAPFRRWDQE